MQGLEGAKYDLNRNVEATGESEVRTFHDFFA